MNLYIGNLDYSIKEKQLTELFAEYGEVTSAKIITDKMTGRSKGFGFVEMSNDEEARQAISGLNGMAINNREMNVTEARPKTDRDNNFSKRY